MGSFVPTTPSERQQMLKTIGVGSVEELFRDVPQEMRIDGYLDLSSGKSEMETMESVSALAEKNHVFRTCLRGAGSYRHYIPAAVKAIVNREEFVTAYTPYQAEISQGILQAIFEYQTMLCELTGMDVSNACVYDGGTAAAESITMCRDRKRTKAYVSATTDPQVIEVMKTYCFGSDVELTVVPQKDGRTDPEALRSLLGQDAACFYVQQPNFYGLLEEAELLGEITHAAGAKYVMGVNPISLAILKTPAECGADVAVGEGQPLGLDTACGQTPPDLFPQQRGKLVAHDSVQNPPRLLGVHQIIVDIPGVADRLLDHLLGDFVKGHPLRLPVGKVQQLF